MVNMMDCNNKGSNFKLQSHYYVHLEMLRTTLSPNHLWIAQSVGAVEYTDCTSAEG